MKVTTLVMLMAIVCIINAIVTGASFWEYVKIIALAAAAIVLMSELIKPLHDEKRRKQ